MRAWLAGFSESVSEQIRYCSIIFPYRRPRNFGSPESNNKIASFGISRKTEIFDAITGFPAAHDFNQFNRKYVVNGVILLRSRYDHHTKLLEIVLPKYLSRDTIY